MLNRVTLIGRLTRNPEARTTKSGKSVTAFSVAVNRRSDEVDYFNVVAWGKTADFVTNYLAKGRLVSVDGRLSWRKYTTSDGQHREIVEIVAESVQGLDKADGGKEPAQAPLQGGETDEYDPWEDS